MARGGIFQYVCNSLIALPVLNATAGKDDPQTHTRRTHFLRPALQQSIIEHALSNLASPPETDASEMGGTSDLESLSLFSEDALDTDESDADISNPQSSEDATPDEVILLKRTLRATLGPPERNSRR